MEIGRPLSAAQRNIFFALKVGGFDPEQSLPVLANGFAMG
jgi:hypothetical protein